MSKKKFPNMGQTKRSTDSIIDDAIAQQNQWQENRRAFARRFLKSLNIFARPNPNKVVAADTTKVAARDERRATLRSYWFPILCAFIVLFIAIWVAFVHTTAPVRVVVEPVPEPTVRAIDKASGPEFDIVRIEKSGNIVIAGRWLPSRSVSVSVNGRIVATQQTDENGEFVYTPTHAWQPGNYTISLVGADSGVKSADRVFVYVSEHGYKNSISLLMTRDGSTLLQSPTMLRDGDLTVSKIDYLDTGRVVVTGDGMPRLRVSLTLDGKYMGFARVSDHHHYGLGADLGKLEPGQEYTLAVRMHDGDGSTVATVEHKFTMPEMTGDDDTFYTVRRGDCLWIIARNFLRRGILFSMIADRNSIENPDLIFPKQKLQIPTKGK